MSDAYYKLDRFIFTPAGRLIEDGHAIPLGSKAGEILRILLNADGAVVRKEELLAAVWPNIAVEENALQVHISALRRALGEAAGRLVTVRGLGYRLEPGDGRGDLHKRSVAILPFLNLTSQPGVDDLVEGLAEELIGTLSQETGLAISGRTAMSRLNNRERDVRAIARELGVAFVLDGSIRASESQMRVTAELIDAATGFQTWAACYEVTAGDNLALEAFLAASIRKDLKVQIATKEGAARTPSH